MHAHRLAAFVLIQFVALTLTAASASAAVPNVTLSQNASSVGRYDVYELTMTDPATYANPWEDVVISAVLTAPSGKTFAVGGFSYDGANTWKLRFAPMEVGAWSWTLRYDAAGGEFTAAGGFAATASANTGFLRIDPANPRRFRTEGDGRPFYPLGFNSGLNVAQNNGLTGIGAYTLADAADFLLTFGQAGNNFWRDNCQSATPIGWGGNFDVNGSGLNRFDPVQCQHMDAEAVALHAAGWKFQLCFWTIPFLNNFDLSNPLTRQATMHLHQFMINRYGAYVDVWELMNEGFPTSAYIADVTAYVRANDPYLHPITLSYPAVDQTPLDAVSPHRYESSTNERIDASIASMTSSCAQWNQPIIVGEAGSGGPSGMYDPDRYRRWIWTTFLNQASPVFWLDETHDSFAAGAGIVNQYIGWEERGASKVMTGLLAGFDVAAQPTNVAIAPASAARAYALASAADFAAYLVHAGDQNSPLVGATATVSLAAAMQGEWIDPLTGESLQAVSVGAGAQALPIPAFRQDIALRLRPGALQPSVVQFASAIASARNDRSEVDLTVRRLGAGTGAISVDWATVDGDAKAGTAYAAASGTLAWAANDLAAKTIAVPIIPQSTMTGDLEFQVALSHATGGAVIGTAPSAQVTLLNTVTDGAVFRAGTYVVAKGATSATIAVDRVGNGSGAWSATLRSADQTAIAGTDYVAIPTTTQLAWAAGDHAAKTFSVPLIANATPGTRNLRLFVEHGSDPILPTRSHLVIADGSSSTGWLAFTGYDRPATYAYNWFGCEYDVAGTAATAQLRVARSDGAVGAASVAYATNGAGTATAGVDYTAVSGTLSWAAGDAADKIISVPLLHRASACGRPWFAVELSAASGALLDLPPIARVVIADVDPAPTLAIVAPAAGPSAGGAMVALTGTGFAAGATVSFGAGAATAVDVVSGESIVCRTPAGAAGAVDVVVTNPDGQVATVTAGYLYQGSGGAIAPTITTPPLDRSVTAGQTATFAVAAAGTAPLSYQWLRDNAAIAGATAASYTTPPTTAADDGSGFSVVVSNAAGSATSVAATLHVAVARAPYGGSPWPIPGTIQAEDFDDGGEGVAYHDSDAGNDGGGYRATDVDIRACVDVGGGWQVGWFGAGEWLEYSVNVAASASYTIAARVANGASGGTIHISVDGVDQTGAMSFGSTGSWDAWTTVTAPASVPLSAGAHIVRLSCDAGALDCNWLSFTASGSGIVSGAWYKLMAKHSGKVVDVAGVSTDNGANVQQWTDWSGPNQIWRLDAQTDGSYEVISKNSGKALDVADASIADGGNVQQSTLNDGPDQRWTFTDVGGGFYEVMNVNSGKVLDVAGISLDDGANIQQWTWWGGDNQRWALVPVAPSSTASVMTAPMPSASAGSASTSRGCGFGGLLAAAITVAAAFVRRRSIG